MPKCCKNRRVNNDTFPRTSRPHPARSKQECRNSGRQNLSTTLARLAVGVEKAVIVRT